MDALSTSNIENGVYHCCVHTPYRVQNTVGTYGRVDLAAIEDRI